jgi:ABC-2 type transport system permease protein
MTFRLRRLRALMLKEWREILRDPLAIRMAVSGPALLMVLFAYGVSLDTERVPVAIVIENPTPEARDLAGAFHNAHYFRSVFLQDRHAAEHALAVGDVSGAVVLAGDFARAVYGEGGAPVQVLVDGVDSRTARTIATYADGAVANWLLQRVQARLGDSIPLVQTESRIWFNPDAKSRNFIAPGLIALLMTVTGALLAALVVAREWERGTMEALMATPALRGDLVFAKLVSYVSLGVGGMALTLAFAVWVMEVPLRGSPIILAVAAALFMVTALSLGFLISSATRNQVRAGRLSLTAGYLPTIMLSGLLFDLRNAPDPIQWISHLVAARYFIAILHTLFLVGNVWAVILPNLAGMAIIALVLLAAIVRLNRKRLG